MRDAVNTDQILTHKNKKKMFNNNIIVNAPTKFDINLLLTMLVSNIARIWKSKFHQWIRYQQRHIKNSNLAQSILNDTFFTSFAIGTKISLFVLLCSKQAYSAKLIIQDLINLVSKLILVFMMSLCTKLIIDLRLVSPT